MELRQRDERKGALSFKTGGTVRMDQYIARAESAAAQAAESAAAAAAQLAQVGANTDAIEALRRDVDSIGEELPGKYTKPFEGIPETDLSAEVQASLGRADTALQPDALSAYRTAAAQDVIDAGKQASLVSGENIKTVNGQTILGAGDLTLPYSRPNLLDNWYFIGGGSQLGHGVLPINQRGQTVYASGYGIDRWKISSSPLQLTAKESGIELQRVSATSSPHFSQKLSQEAPAGVYTASLLYKASLAEGDFVSIVALDNGSGLILGTIDSSKADWTLASFTFTVTGSMTDFRIQFIVDSTQVDDAIELAALKLERGSYQTLAHEINGEWVLNEIPDYGEELAKCQRYLQLIPASADYMTPFGYGLAMSTTEYRITIPLPTPMVKTPSITIDNCSLRFYQENLSSGSYISTYSAVSVIGGNAATLKYKPYVGLRFTVSGATAAKPATMIVTGQSGSNTRSGFLLSAED